MGKTLAQLREEVRSYADIVDSPHIDDDELEAFINYGWRALYALIVKTYEDFRITSTDITIISGTSEYSLAAISPPVLKLRGVDLQANGSTRFVPMSIARWEDRGMTDAGSGLTGTMRVWYIPKSPPLVDTKPAAEWADPDVPEPETGAPADAIVAIPDYIDDGWTELIVLEAALRCATKEEGMAGNLPALAAILDRKRAEIVSMAPGRDANEPQAAVDRTEDDAQRYLRRDVPVDTRYLFQGMSVRIWPTP